MIAAIGLVALAVGLIMDSSRPGQGYEASTPRPVGRYCLVKPGALRPHCEGVPANQRDPVLAAIKIMNQQGEPATMASVLP